MSNPTPTNDSAWDQLLRDLVEGQLNEQHESQLAAAIETDDAALDDYIAYVSLHALLKRRFAPQLAEPKDDAQHVVETGRNQHWWSPVVDTINNNWTASILVSGLFITTIMLLLALWTLPVLQPPTVDGFVPTSADMVARVTRTHAARWSDEGQGSWEDLVAGQQVTLLEGLAEFRFDSGALILLQGPATLRPLGDNRCELLSGDLTARVNQRAVGFAVITPTATVVDLGTEFGVGVGAEGHSEVYVFEGKVEVSSVSAGTESSVQKQQLAAGESVYIARDGEGWQESASLAKRFRRIETEMPLDSRPTKIAVFQQGAPDPFTGEIYSGCDDVQLLEWGPDNNFGARGDFDVGNVDSRRTAHSLVRFDLTSMQGKFATIRSLTLQLTTSDQPYAPAGEGEVLLFRLNDNQADWNEGNLESAQAGATTTPGAVTWNHFAFPATAWQGKAGASRAGTDYFPIIYASRPYTRDFPKSTAFDLQLTGNVKFAEAWANGAPNAGFLLKNRIENRVNRINFVSSEAESVDQHPRLIVEFVPFESGP